MFTSMKNGTDYTITTSTNGLPTIAYINASTKNLLYNEHLLFLSEAYCRLYPVIRDKNTLVLTDGSNTATLTSTSNIATSMKSSTTTVARLHYCKRHRCTNKLNNKFTYTL